jgi:aspartokinase/homoserine dehydrogenase 1
MFFTIANSKNLLLNKKNELSPNWKNEIQTNIYTIIDVIAFANENNMENLIAIDNTANLNLCGNYVTAKIVST